MQYEGEYNRPKESHSGLLSSRVRERLLPNIEVSKSFEYKMKNSVRKKVQILFDQTCPHLLKLISSHLVIVLIKKPLRGLSRRLRRLSTLSYKSLCRVEVVGSNPAPGSSFSTK
jgi:hypothetical protein